MALSSIPSLLAALLLGGLPASGPAEAVALGEARSDTALVVMAASSLVEVMPELVRSGLGSPPAEVVPVFDATSRLARQLGSGAPGDVLIAADAEWMRWAVEGGFVDRGSVRRFAANALAVIVPAQAGVPEATPSGPDGLTEPWARRIMLAGEEVPAGRYAREGLEASGHWDALADRVVRGGSVRQVLEWVARGEADVGVVYRTDAVGDDRVTIAFELAPAPGTDVVYLAGATTSGRRAEALSFLAGLAAPSSTAILAAAGFSEPPGGWGAPADQELVELGAADPAAPSPATATAATEARLGPVIRLSLIVAFFATLIGLVPALFLGRLLARHEFPGKTLVLTVVLIPLVLPPVVTGYLLLGVFGRNAPLGRFLEAVGLEVAFAPTGAVIAAAVVGFPLLVLAIRSAFEATDPELEELAWTLGDRPRRSFFRVAVPLAFPGIAAGMVLAFARALGEFGATIVLAGNVPGRTRTIPLAVYSFLEAPEAGGAVRALVWASILLSLGALAGYELLLRRRGNGHKRATTGGMP